MPVQVRRQAATGDNAAFGLAESATGTARTSREFFRRLAGEPDARQSRRITTCVTRAAATCSTTL